MSRQSDRQHQHGIELWPGVYGSSSLELFWDEAYDSSIGGHAKTYNIYVNGAFHTNTSNRTSFYFDGLASGTTFSYEIEGVYAGGQVSQRVGPVVLTTTGGSSGGGNTATYAGPGNFHGAVYSTHALELFWDEAYDPTLGGHAKRYKIYQDGQMIEETTNRSSFFIQNLDSGRWYTYHIVAVYAGGEESAQVGPEHLQTNA